MLTTVPESSVSLVGLPSPSWTHLWTAWLPFPEWWKEDLAGLQVMPTRPLLAEPTEELWSCLSNSWSSGTMLWQPTTGPVGVLTCHDAPALPWTPPCPTTCDACCDDGVAHPVLMNWLDLETYFWQSRHCKLSNAETHSQELEVLAWCQVGLLEVDNPS